MPKIKLDFESDLTPIETAFGKGNSLITQSSDAVKGFGKDATTAYKSATTEANKYAVETKTATAQTGALSKSTEAVGKSAQTIRVLRQELNVYVSAAQAAGKGTEEWTENLEKAAETKEQIKELQSVLGGIGDNQLKSLTQGFGLLAQTGIQGAEGIVAAQGLLGEKNEDIEKQLVKLQSLQALANLAGEFSELGEKATQFKVAFAPIGALYTNANNATKEFFKNGLTGFSGLLSGAKNFFSNFGSNLKSFVSSGISGIKSLFAVAAANPFALILIVITAIIGTMVLLKDKVKPIAELFSALGDVISYLGDKVEELGQFFGIAASESEKANQKIIDGSKDALAAIAERYNFEIAYVEATGKSSIEVEKAKLNATLDGINKAIVALKFKVVQGNELNKEELKDLDELYKERVKTIQEAIIDEAKEIKKGQDEEDKRAKEKADKDAKAAEKLKQLRKDLADFLLDLEKKSNAAEIDLLTGEDKINAQRKASQEEIDLLKQTLIKKQVAAGEGNKIAAAQQAEFNNLELAADRKQAQDLIKLAADTALAQAEANKKEADTQVNFNDTREKIAEDYIKALQKPKGVSEEEFEKLKNLKLLELQKQFAIDSLDVKEKEIDAEAELEKTQLQNQIDALGSTDDAKKVILQKQLDNIKTNSDLQKDALFASTQNLVNSFTKSIVDLENSLKKNKFDLAALLGLTPEGLEFVKKGAQETVSSLIQIGEDYLQGANQRLDQELQANNDRQQSREDNLSDLKDQLQTETDLQKQGLANNVNRIRDEIAAEEAAKVADIARAKQIQEEKKKIAKEQLIIDTALQASQLVLAIANLFAEGSKYWVGPVPVGLIVAGVAATAMVGAFIAGKVAAFNAVNSQDAAGFKKGGYTGGGSENEERGVVHGLEFVHTATKTKQYRNLFEGIHKDDRLLMHQGILELIKDQGIMLEPDLPFSLANKKDELRVINNTAQFTNTNKGVEKRIDDLNYQVMQLSNQLKDKTTVLPNGTIIEKKGNVTRTIKRK